MTGFSVIVPTYNGAEYLAATLESILSQELAPHEILVCDDGSSDGTRDLLARYARRVRVLTQPNSGVSSARNRAAREATGDWLAFLDQDDLWEPQHLRQQALRLQASPECGFAYADSRVIEGDGTPRGKRSEDLQFQEGHVFDALLEGNFIPIETLVVRRSLFASVGGFRSRYRLLEDYELCLRLSRRSPVALSREVLASYRVHASNVTHDRDGILHEYVHVLEELLAAHPELDQATGAHVRRVLRRRHAELAWYALRRLAVKEAEGHMQRAGKDVPARLRFKVKALDRALRVLPSPANRALLALLPGPRVHGVRRGSS